MATVEEFQGALHIHISPFESKLTKDISLWFSTPKHLIYYSLELKREGQTYFCRTLEKGKFPMVKIFREDFMKKVTFDLNPLQIKSWLDFNSWKYRNCISDGGTYLSKGKGAEYYKVCEKVLETDAGKVWNPIQKNLSEQII